MLKPSYYISDDDEFVIENYNHTPTFSSFFPGIAGIYGVPMWAFYANRGQCVTSMGVHDKDGAIMEFLAANKAYRNVSLNGFRTLIKVDGKFYEPFSERSSHSNKMKITSYDLKLSEENRQLKLKVEVNYFTLPNEHFPGFVRTLKITDLSGKKRKMEVIDGIPTIIPFGFANSLLKNISRTIEAWSIVENLENNAPFYKLKITPVDISETKFIRKGNFYVSFANIGSKQTVPEVIVNPKTVFGKNSSLEYPANFIEKKDFAVPKVQMKECFIPSAFSFEKFILPAKKTYELYSVIGHIDSLECLNKNRKRIMHRKYIQEKADENKAVIRDITGKIGCKSSSRSFDLYAKQTFLDNVMRGGLPVNVGGNIFYVYYRKHGDMERDYNDFKLLPAYLSQGSGNYRDINQNRRNDIFFEPDVGEYNIFKFINLIQLDGFNPLVVMGSKYQVNSREAAKSILDKHLKGWDQRLIDIMLEPFVLGALLKETEHNGTRLLTDHESFISDLIDNSRKVEEAVHGEGFWIDHFSYNLDLLESYEAIFPEKMNDLMLSDRRFTYYDNDHVVLPRKEKYFDQHGKIRQFRSVRSDLDKKALIETRDSDANIVRKDFGKGDIFRTTLISKLICLVANKSASFDPEGIGIEMEADKPGWYDALNGLPALIGSSISETLELKHLSAYILKFVDDNSKVDVPVEIRDLADGINKELNDYFKCNDDFCYWENTNRIKEKFREIIKFGINGEETTLEGGYIKKFLTDIHGKCEMAVDKMLKKYGNYYTYFINEAVQYEKTGGSILIKKFEQRPLPLFLEGFVHALKVTKDKDLYKKVRKSELYDKNLKMYKMNGSLKDAPLEIGRAKVFTPGWLENGSIWLHMEYKYLLEMLKAGLYKEFFADLKNALVPFMDPSTYKRSILENSSFIVSSVNPDKDNHGRGFVARMSGATAEFIDMWIRMTTGKDMFFVDKEGKLNFKLSPVLPTWLFKDGKFTFTLLGSIEVVYINKKKKDTFDGGVSPASYKLFLEGKELDVNGPSVPEPYSKMIRDRKVSKIIVTLS